MRYKDIGAMINWGGGGGKALTMTMTDPGIYHMVKWSKKLIMTMKSWNLPIVNGQNLSILTM